MLSEKKSEYLIGQLLVAMPDIGDPRFAKSVILLCFHSEEGAMGVVLNKPAGKVKISDIMQNGDKDSREEFDTIPIHFGGPVEQYRAIFVHSRDCEEYSSTKFVSEEFGLTTTPDILEDFSKGKGPTCSKLLLGYAGWSPGQLEDEISEKCLARLRERSKNRFWNRIGGIVECSGQVAGDLAEHAFFDGRASLAVSEISFFAQAARRTPDFVAAGPKSATARGAD